MKYVIENLTGRDDGLLKVFVPTPNPVADINPLAPPPFEIGGPAGQPTILPTQPAPTPPQPTSPEKSGI